MRFPLSFVFTEKEHQSSRERDEWLTVYIRPPYNGRPCCCGVEQSGSSTGS